MSELFQTTPQNITIHLKNIFEEGELDEMSTCKDFLQVQMEGKRKISRKQKFYNLDTIISIGYRVKSKVATQFRQWATQRLKDYLVQGYAINEKRLAQKQQEVEYLKTGIRILKRAIGQQATEDDSQMLRVFAKGLALLDDYGHQTLETKGKTLWEAIYPSLAQVAVFAALNNGDFASLVDARLYLPQDWCENPARCHEAGRHTGRAQDVQDKAGSGS